MLKQYIRKIINILLIITCWYLLLKLISSNEDFSNYGEPAGYKSFPLSVDLLFWLTLLTANGFIRFIIPKTKLSITNILGTICELINILVCTIYFNNIRETFKMDYLFDFISCILIFGALILGVFPEDDLFPWDDSYDGFWDDWDDESNENSLDNLNDESNDD